MDAAEKRHGIKFIFVLISLFLITLLISIYCLSIGTADISFFDIAGSLFGFTNADTVTRIIFEIRVPRILLALAVGGGLSAAGAVFQAVLMNPLAEPYILGISSGGTFGAVLAIFLGLSFFVTQAFAFIGALMVIGVVFFLSKRFGEVEPNILLLTGVMIGAFFSAAVLLLITILGDSLREAIFWMIGNLAFADMSNVAYVLPVSVLISFVLVLNGQKFNVLSLGKETAKHLGVNTTSFLNITYVLTSLLVSTIVSVSGLIGFVGLLVPHVTRLIFGTDNRIIIPASFFIGASYLVAADTIARVIVSPAELPVGAITALIGAPVFILILKRKFNIYN